MKNTIFKHVLQAKCVSLSLTEAKITKHFKKSNIVSPSASAVLTILVYTAALIPI